MLLWHENIARCTYKRVSKMVLHVSFIWVEDCFHVIAGAIANYRPLSAGYMVIQ